MPSHGGLCFVIAFTMENKDTSGHQLTFLDLQGDGFTGRIRPDVLCCGLDLNGKQNLLYELNVIPYLNPEMKCLTSSTNLIG